MSELTKGVRRPNRKVKKKAAEPKSCCSTHELRCFFHTSHLWKDNFTHFSGESSKPNERKCFDCGGLCTTPPDDNPIKKAKTKR